MEEQNKVKNIEESQENWLKTIERKMMHIKYTKERRWLRIEERGNIMVTLPHNLNLQDMISDQCEWKCQVE